MRRAFAACARPQPFDQGRPMKIRSRMICCVLPVVFLSACKKSDTAPGPTATLAPTTNPAPANPAPAAAPAAAPANADASASAEASAKMAARSEEHTAELQSLRH